MATRARMAEKSFYFLTEREREGERGFLRDELMSAGKVEVSLRFRGLFSSLKKYQYNW